jgi:Kef-type K+ transport system membrane component KefB
VTTSQLTYTAGVVIAVLLAAFLARKLARLVGQPSVVGEIAVGLGVPPAAIAAGGTDVLPTYTSTTLLILGHIGLVMFLAATAHRMKAIRVSQHGVTLGAVLGGIFLIPLTCGAALAAVIMLSGRPELRGTAPDTTFILMVALSLAVTAVPVLARILAERHLDTTPVGHLAITAAVLSDLAAWLLLVIALGLTPSTDWLWVGEIITAVLVGLALPTRVAQMVHRVGMLLVPVYFVATGITVFTGRHDPVSWGATAITAIVTIALGTTGKIGGGYLGGRLGGLDRRHAVQLGVLVNTRGLTELIVLQIGANAGILTPTFFLALVVMALATTALTGPLYQLVDHPRSGGDETPNALTKISPTAGAPRQPNDHQPGAVVGEVRKQPN